METAKIRKAGYPIRHTYREFIDRYRHVVPGIGPAQKIDCKEATKTICNKVLPSGSDFEFGKTKVFLKEAHDLHLEELRKEIYFKSILIIQRGFRRLIFKRFIRKHREAAITIQKNFRARGYRNRFLQMRMGYRRLQAVIRSRQLAYQHNSARKRIIQIQAYCRGYLTRKNLKGKMDGKSKMMHDLLVLKYQEEKDFRMSGNPHWQAAADANYKLRVNELLRDLEPESNISSAPKMMVQPKINIEEEKKMVDEIFGFLQEPTSPVPATKLKHTSSIGVSRMLKFFETKNKHKKVIPTKLLSRPVNYYDYESSRL